MEVGLASPGATHFFLVRWCFPGCPTNLMPFGTEIFTWTCESFGNVIHWKCQLQSQTDLCERCETHRMLHKKVTECRLFILQRAMDWTESSTFSPAILQVFLGDATGAGQMGSARRKHQGREDFLGKKNSFKINCFWQLFAYEGNSPLWFSMSSLIVFPVFFNICFPDVLQDTSDYSTCYYK